MVAVLGYSKDQIRIAVQNMYTLVANRPQMPQHFPTGRDACKLVGYSEDMLDGLPDSALESFAGVGCPFSAQVIRPGQKVLDIGSGSGTDALIAAKLVGASGKVWALDMTSAMRAKLEQTVSDNNIGNVETLDADAEAIPLPDNCVDVVTSNGVLNLVADKRRAIAEIFRVLKPGGQVQIADIVIDLPVTPDCENDPKLWAECVVGATIKECYLDMFRDAGFEDVEVLRDYDYFALSPSADTQEVAKQFGASAIELRMRRGARAPATLVQWAKRLDPRRMAAAVRRRGLWGTVTMALALLSCYGTLAIVALLSVLGVTVAVNESAWAASIILFALLTTGIIALGVRRHKHKSALVMAIGGVAVLVYAMAISYHLVTEVVGFALLGTATWRDYDLRRWAPVSGGKKRARKVKAPGVGDSI